ncbi:hypothetical protein F4776DRAFT_675751 [Hypoxylon sp. NC0597]|nr:hypothetical protein F4776DRAFT_675751 [Hypoxylon sp. NC0597]
MSKEFHFMVNKAVLGWTTADAFVADSQDLYRFKDVEFDAVIMNLGIFALSDPVAGAAEMYRTFKTGGHAMITTWKIQRAAEVLQDAADAIRPNCGLKPMYMAPEWLTKEKPLSITEAGWFSNGHIKSFASAPDVDDQALERMESRRDRSLG